MSRGRWAVIIVAVCLVVTVAAVAYAAGKAKAVPVAEVVRARKFELVDAKGRTRGEFGLIEAVGLPEDPSLSLFDEKGRGRAYLGLSPNGSPYLYFTDAKRELRAFLGLEPDGSPCLKLYDEKGKERAGLGATALETTRTGDVEKRAESSLVLFDKEGKVLWQAP